MSETAIQTLTTTLFTTTTNSGRSLSPSSPTTRSSPVMPVSTWSYPMIKPRFVHAGKLRAFTPHHELPTTAAELGYQQLTEQEIRLFSRSISAAAGHTRAKLEDVPQQIGLEHKFYTISDAEIEDWMAIDDKLDDEQNKHHLAPFNSKLRPQPSMSRLALGAFAVPNGRI